MAETILHQDSQVAKWDARFFAEYVRDNRFRPYMGESQMMPIIAKHELTSGGKQINIPLITRLKGSGVQDNARLSGNEEALGNYNHPITIRFNRNGVEIPEPEEHWTEMDLRRATRDVLKTWAAESLRDDLITAMMDFGGASYVASDPLTVYGAATESVKDAWLAANADRYLFGAVRSNNASNDHSAALAEIDNTADKLTPALASLAKEMARTADPHIRPFRVEEEPGREFFVMFCNPRSFRDLKRSDEMRQANRDARPRSVGQNPIFQDGDLIYDGVIFREVPEIPSLAGVGAGGIDVAPNFLCGAQAIGVAWGKRPTSRSKKEDDYGHFTGLAISEARGVSKLVYDGIQHGMVTVYTAGVASA